MPHRRDIVLNWIEEKVATARYSFFKIDTVNTIELSGKYNV